VLVVGAGTGAELIECGRRYPGWSFTAVDPSPAMVRRGAEKLAQHGLSTRVTWHDTSLKKVPAGEAFDAATLLLVLHFLPDDGGKQVVLEQISERLKPGAPFILSTFAGDPTTTRTKKIYELSKAHALSQGVPDAEVQDKFNLARPDIHLIPEDRIKALLRDAGFIDVQRIFQSLALTTWCCRTQR
jgi:tRNA (cmo5U34)-methyltransferase